MFMQLVSTLLCNSLMRHNSMYHHYAAIQEEVIYPSIPFAPQATPPLEASLLTHFFPFSNIHLRSPPSPSCQTWPRHSD